LFYVDDQIDRSYVLEYIFEDIYKSNPVITGFYYMPPYAKNDEYVNIIFGETIEKYLSLVEKKDSFADYITENQLNITTNISLY